MDKRAEQIGQVVHATMPVTLTAKADEKGKVTALVSAYGIEYRIGWRGKHRIEAGAFAESLASHPSIPLFWEHAWASTIAPGIPIGDATGAEEDDGLLISGQLYIEDSEVARVHRAMLAGAIREWSIGYRVLEARYPADDPDLTIVTKGELLEASSVVKGANPDTETRQVASGRGTEMQIVVNADTSKLDEAIAKVAALAAAAAPPTAQGGEDEPALAADPEHLLSRPEYRALLAEQFAEGV